MIKNVHIINAHQRWEGVADGNLTKHFVSTIINVLAQHNVNYTVTNIDDGYTIENEVASIVAADIVILQFPMYWMGLPWLGKKYIDEVFMSGYGKIYRSDGRDVENALYGSGGLLTNKYMLSITANAPLEAFNAKEQLFHGLGIDDAFIAVHNAFKFVGATPLPTFIANDIFKAPQIEADTLRLAGMIEDLLK